MELLNEKISKIRKESQLTQEMFAKKMGISKNYVNLIENGKKKPSDRLISDICRNFNVNKDWLKTGVGEPYIPQTQNQEIMAFANDVMSEENESFRKRFVTAISKARPEFWDELEKVVDDILKKD